MKRVIFKKLATFMLLLLMSVLLMQFVWHVSETDQHGSKAPASKINLALRRTADLLLRQAGDSTSRIAPVEQISAHGWLIRLERNFSYDSLPFYLQSSFQLHQIQSNYDVAVIACADGTLQLGYNFAEFAQNQTMPCGGREMIEDCYNLQVTMLDQAAEKQGLPLMGWLFSSALALALFSLNQRWRRSSTQPNMVIASDSEPVLFGHSSFDVVNQTLVCAGKRHDLTYREAKLLHLFVQHPNQVLERSLILEKVWADEGILVGRSVDMFVSRLRKMLRDDSAVQLLAVHGVGYRMELS